MADFYKDIPIMITAQQIKKRVAELGKQISLDYADKNLLLVSVLKGSVVFMSDIMREIFIPCKIDFMCVSSYNKSTISSGNINIIKDLTIDIENFDVLIIEDIMDSGITLSKLCRMLKSRRPKSLNICTLLDKPSKRIAEISPNYTGFVIKDEFIIGYGLDYAEEYRHLPFIGILPNNKI